MANVYIDVQAPVPLTVFLDGDADRILLVCEFGDESVLLYVDDSEQALEIARAIEAAVQAYRAAGGV